MSQWQRFLSRNGGKGYTMKQLSSAYKKDPSARLSKKSSRRAVKKTSKKSSRKSSKGLKKTITFAKPPFGVVSIKAGDFGYKKNTSVRLSRGKDGLVYFKIKGRKYLQDPKNSRKFHLQ